MTETQRELFKAAQDYSRMATRIHETGILSPEDAAEIARGLAFLHAELGSHRPDSDA
jgi:hypothetical protein